MWGSGGQVGFFGFLYGVQYWNFFFVGEVYVYVQIYFGVVGIGVESFIQVQDGIVWSQFDGREK